MRRRTERQGPRGAQAKVLIHRKEFAMCPMCLAASGLYVVGGVSAGAFTTFFATKLLRKRPEPAISTETEGDDHAATDDRLEE